MKTIITPADLPKYVPREIWLDAVDGRWSELSIHGYKYKPSDISPPGLADYLLVLYTGGPTRMSRRVGGLRLTSDIVFGDISLFRNSPGVAPHQYLLRRRLDQALTLVQDNRRSIAEIASATGFGDQSHLTRHFKRRFGVTPQGSRKDDRRFVSNASQEALTDTRLVFQPS